MLEYGLNKYAIWTHFLELAENIMKRLIFNILYILLKKQLIIKKICRSDNKNKNHYLQLFCIIWVIDVNISDVCIWIMPHKRWSYLNMWTLHSVIASAQVWIINLFQP